MIPALDALFSTAAAGGLLVYAQEFGGAKD